MMKKFFCFSALFLFLFSLSFGKSLWDNGLNVYKVYVKKGEIVKIKFTDKTIMKYQIEQKQNNYQATKGKKGGGELFSFFPSAEVNENDNIKNQNNLSINNVNQFAIPAKVTEIDGDTVSIQGQNMSLINGETFKIEISGEFDLPSISPDSSILSTEIYNLDFKVYRESPTNAALFNANDLEFSTNYSEITSNQVYNPTNNTTNIMLVTNMSSVKLEFKGIRDEKKKDILMNYLNFIVSALFR
jgi:hypothetical protein